MRTLAIPRTWIGDEPDYRPEYDAIVGIAQAFVKREKMGAADAGSAT